MNVEGRRDNYNVVTSEGDVVSFHDAQDIEVSDIAHLDTDLETMYPGSIESSLRNHPAAQDMSEPEISRLAQGIIDEIRQRHMRRRKARAIFEVLRHPALSSEDRSAIALEAGLPVNVFNIQPESLATPNFEVNGSSRKYEEQDRDSVDFAKRAANDRDY